MADLPDRDLIDRVFPDRDLIVVIPSRGRPETVAELDRAFVETCTNETTVALLAIDEDDPAHDDYIAAMVGCHRLVAIHEQSSGTMVSALNAAALSVARDWVAVGFCGDDHRPRTQGWDQAYLDALREMGTGIVYGNDLLQGEALPTQVAMTSDIIRELGFMAPPQLVHLAVDNWWRELGRIAGCIRYLPDVIVEHMHPVAGKAEWDEGHKRVNAPEMYDKDLTTFAHLQMRELPGAIMRVRALRIAGQLSRESGLDLQWDSRPLGAP